MGRVTPFTKVPTGNSDIDRLQDRLSEALRVVRQSPQALVTARGSLVAATGDGAPAEHPIGDDGAVLRAASTEDTGLIWGAALPFLNVLDYGADATGTISSTAAVTAALAALPTAGGRIWFPPGIYKVNISTTRYGVVFMGSGAGSVTSGLGGTELVADNAASPVIQIGDGAVTTCRGNRVQDMILTGDGVNATGDGVYLYGARDVVIDNVAITAFGRDCLRIRSNTASSSGIYVKGCALSGAKHANLYAEYGASFVTHVVLDACHLNSASSAGSYSVYLDSVVVWMLGTYLDLHDGATGGHVAMVKNFATTPGIIAQAAAFDNADGVAAVSLDVSTVFAKAARLSSAISGSYTFNGKVIYSDGTVQQTTSCNAQLYQPRVLNPSVMNKLYFPLDEADIASNTVGLSRSGTTGGGSEVLSLGGSARLSLNGVQLTRVTVTYSASMTPDCQLGSIFEITPSNGTAFTINAPTHQFQGQFFTVRVINTFGVLGAVTWGGTYKMAAWAAPANGFSQSITFYREATNIYEVSRTPVDVPN